MILIIKKYQIKTHLRLPKSKESSHPFAHLEITIVHATFFQQLFMQNLKDFSFFKKCATWATIRSTYHKN